MYNETLQHTTRLVLPTRCRHVFFIEMYVRFVVFLFMASVIDKSKLLLSNNKMNIKTNEHKTKEGRKNSLKE